MMCVFVGVLEDVLYSESLPKSNCVMLPCPLSPLQPLWSCDISMQSPEGTMSKFGDVMDLSLIHI